MSRREVRGRAVGLVVATSAWIGLVMLLAQGVDATNSRQIGDWDEIVAEYEIVHYDQGGPAVARTYSLEAATWDSWEVELLAVRGLDPQPEHSPDAVGTRRAFDGDVIKVQFPSGHELSLEVELEKDKYVVPDLFFGPAVMSVPSGSVEAESGLEAAIPDVANALEISPSAIRAVASQSPVPCPDKTDCGSVLVERRVDALVHDQLGVPIRVDVSVGGKVRQSLSLLSVRAGGG